MGSQNEYEVVYHFNAIGKKMVRAANYEEVKRLIETAECLQPDSILEMNEPCRVYEIHSLRTDESSGLQERHILEYENWGSE
jgi:hypothetical protein